MNSPFYIPIDFELLLQMENMNAEFVAEGLTATRRAIDAYLKKRGTVDDVQALKLLNDLEKAIRATKSDADIARVREIRTRLGRLVGETDFDSSFFRHPEASPLALLGMAQYSLDPRFGRYSTFHALVYLKTALEHGCDAALGSFADLILSDRVTPDCVELKSWLTDYLKNPSEDFLLVAGQRIARWNLVEERFASKIRQGLKKLAENGHVDALRLLALSHTEVKPETAWAREEILAQAKRGKAFALLIKAQHLAALFPFWRADGDEEENDDLARSILERSSLKSNLWAGVTLAFLLLPHRLPDGRPASNRDGERAREILYRLAYEEDFAPAKAMIGVLQYTKGDPELAWPPLRDACRQNFSWTCEAACADYLVGMAVHASLVGALGKPGFPGTKGHDLNNYGGFMRWYQSALSLADGQLFGPLSVAILGLLMRGQQFPEVNGRLDVATYSRKIATLFQGDAAIWAYLLNLCQKDSPDVLEWRERLVSLVNSSAAHGNPACLLANIFFRKLLFVEGFRTYDLLEVMNLCLSMGPATNLARATLSVVTLVIEHDRTRMDMHGPNGTIGFEMHMLARDHARALLVNDLPFLCLMPILFKMAEETFPKEAVQAALDLVSMHFHGRKEDLAGFINSTSKKIIAPGVDLGLLWTNLGFEPGVDLPGSAAPRKAKRRQSKNSRNKR